jgi:hypothetical protein
LFIHPLFLVDTLDREPRAVDSENKEDLQSDQRSMFSLIKESSSEKHQYHNFATGSYKTSHDDPLAKGTKIRDAHTRFYKEHYSANRMKLVVLGRETLDELQEWVEEFFIAVPDRNLPQLRWNGATVSDKRNLGIELSVKPSTRKRPLDVHSPHPDGDDPFQPEPGHDIPHLVDHEGPDNLLVHLKAKGRANRWSASVTHRNLDCSNYHDTTSSPNGNPEYCHDGKLDRDHNHKEVGGNPGGADLDAHTEQIQDSGLNRTHLRWGFPIPSFGYGRHLSRASQKQYTQALTYALAMVVCAGAGAHTRHWMRALETGEYDSASAPPLIWIPVLAMAAYANAETAPWNRTQMLGMAAYSNIHSLPKSWIRLLAISAVITYTDALLLSPHQSALNGSAGDMSDTGVSSDTKENNSFPRITGLVIAFIAFTALLGGVTSLVAFRTARERKIHVMGYTCVLTLVIAAAPMVLHQAGGIDAEVNGPLWALWAGAYFNFVLLGVLLVRHEQFGYLSPLGYVGVVAVLSHFVFLAADKHSSRLYTTLVTLGVTIVQDFGLRAFFGGLCVSSVAQSVENRVEGGPLDRQT